MKTNQRKEPLTTIAVSIATATKIDEFIEGKNLSRKQFVEMSLDYFLRTGYDLKSDYSDLTPLQNVVEDLKETNNKQRVQNNTIISLLQKIEEMQTVYVQKALPAQTEAKTNEEYKKIYIKLKKILSSLCINQKSIRIGKIKKIVDEIMYL